MFWIITPQRVPHSPRAMLKAQIARLRHGFLAMMATELEFFLFEKSLTKSRKGLSRSETDQRLQRRLSHLPDHQGRRCDAPSAQPSVCCGIPLRDQRARPKPAKKSSTSNTLTLMCAIITHRQTRDQRNCLAAGHAATFLPKWHKDRVGSASHVHQSLWQDGEAAFMIQIATSACPN